MGRKGRRGEWAEWAERAEEAEWAEMAKSKYFESVIELGGRLGYSLSILYG
ncbi:MAG: hypothetical protein ABJB16_13100 [Saprospiraceae bacterium]